MKLDFEYLKKEILATNVKSEYKQSSIIILRNIFKEAETKQLSIHSVVGQSEQFYCYERIEYENAQCEKQCKDCKKFVENGEQ